LPSRQNSTNHLFIYKPTYLGQYKYVTQCKLDFILRLVPVMCLCRPRGVSMSLRVVQLVRPQLTTPYKKNLAGPSTGHEVTVDVVFGAPAD
jgi:hypothetical protein